MAKKPAKEESDEAETEAPAAFDDLGHPVDMDDLFLDVEPLRFYPLCHSAPGCEKACAP